MYRLGEKNDFQVERAPFSKPVGVFWTAERQKQEAKRIFDLQEQPAFAYVEHMNFMNFRPFHHPQPIYINLVRDPVERVISWFYYKRTPWNSVKMFEITGKFQNRSHYFSVLCRFNVSIDRVILSRPFNTPAAIAKAKQNVERDYSVVGSWEDVNVTLTVLEHYIPRFFKGVTDLYYEPEVGLAFKKMNTNHWKPKISERIKRIMRANFTQEYDFYHFVKQRLYRQYFAIKKDMEL
ncbi:heparan sulfate 2-O-sulfotransferase pipe [Drosophila ananassae]|uniref:heparan sulfate 2-O-sulfotransferase pipe n=1 Tax=Drosophila ananassae TaxID=7217 RepID=UPI001CFF659E|nr:heparan sulfate 2-O-sulfotransferase pipe [Drosophila ananassae]